MNRKRYKTFLSITLAVLTAFCFLALCSKDSPLYPMNDWVDVNCFMTVGRCVLDGRVLYADIYEQKGPLLYFVFAFTALISSESFIGVFLVELACFAAFLYSAALLARLFHKSDSVFADFAVMAVLAFAEVNSGSFAHGCSVEQLNLFMLTVSLYFMLKAIKAGTSVGQLQALIIGCFAGVALWSKFTICGFYLGLCVYILISYLKDSSKRKRILGEVLAFAAGVLAVSAPILLYFILNNAVKDLMSAYFYNNIFVYTSNSGSHATILFALPIHLLIGLKSILLDNLPADPFFLFAIIYYLFLRKEQRKESAILLYCSVFLLLSTFSTPTRHLYYSHVFLVFAPVGIACAAEFIKGKLKKPAAVKQWILVPCAAVALPVLLAVSYFINSNTYLLNYPREKMPQYRFAEKIKEYPDSTLLNYNFLDGGFYFAAEKLPITKFFCTLNIALPCMYEELDSTVMNREVDFIVTRDLALEETFSSDPGYHCVDITTLYHEGSIRTYRLYMRDGL